MLTTHYGVKMLKMVESVPGITFWSESKGFDTWSFQKTAI